jgi:class 3 adenylate cyclase
MNILKLLRWNRKPISPQKFSGEGTILISFFNRFDQVAITSRTPERLVELLKNHLATQLKIIENHSGIVLSFVGDSIIAFWPNVDSQYNFCLQAFEAAKKMLSNTDKVVDYQIVLGTGLIAGDFFGPRKQYQVVGEAMDVADQLSKFHFPAHRVILFTDSTKSQLNNLSVSFQTIGQLKNGSDILACIN